MALTVPNTFVAGTTAVASEVNDNFAAVKTFVDGLETDVTALETKSPVITLAGDLTGSATLTNLGNATLTATIAANSVALGTDTTGNYVSNVTAGTGVTVTHTPGEGSSAAVAIDGTVVTLSGTQTLTNKTLTSPTITGVSPVVTLSGDVTGSATLTNLGSATITTTIAANSVALGADTTGNYVSTITAGTGITGSASSESATPTIAIDTAVVPQLGVANTFTTNQVIAASSTSDLLRITQTGTGNALVVEDSANPDSTPFVVDTSGRVVVGSSTAATTRIGATTITAPLQNLGTTNATASSLFARYSNDVTAPNIFLAKSRDTNIGSFTTVAAADQLGVVSFAGADGTQMVEAARITALVEGTVSTGVVPGFITFQTASSAGTLTERMRIDSAGQVGIGSTTTAGQNLRIAKNLTGGTTARGVVVSSTVQSDVTSLTAGYSTFINTDASAFTLTSLTHYLAQQGTIGATSAVTNQYGFWVDASLTGATNNYGFYGNIASGTSRYNLYMNGTADNYLAGSLGIGISPTAGRNLEVRKAVTGATEAFSIFAGGNIQSDVTAGSTVFAAGPGVAAGVTVPLLYHFGARGVTLGSGAAATTVGGFVVSSTMTQGTNNRGFWGALDTAANTYNLYMSGTAPNYLAGRLGVGAALTSGAMAQITNTTAADIGLIVRGAASQTGYLTDWQNSSGTNLAYVDSSGNAKFVSIDGGSA